MELKFGPAVASAALIVACAAPAVGQTAPAAPAAAQPPRTTLTAPPAPPAPPASPAATPAAAQPDTPCELHVWPAERFQSMTQGWLGGFGALGGLADAASHAGKDKANRTKMATALDPQGQLDALGSLELTKLLEAKPARVVLHPEPLDRKTINKISVRRAQSASPCYSELIVADLFYHKAPIWGSSLKTLFLYRDFGAAKDKPTIRKSWGGNSLKLFPPKEGEDVQAANAELVKVFKADFEEFAHDKSKAAHRPK
jgi:hypothetical protein